MNRYEEYRSFLYPFILAEHTKHPSYGYHAIAAMIRDKTGLFFSDNLIHKICKAHDIKSKAKHYGKKRAPAERIVAENLIQAPWFTRQPMQILVSDMTVLKIKGRKYEWCYVLDIYNRAIVASSISARAGDIRIYHDCLHQILESIKKKGYTHPIYYHTDQGSVYTSRAHYEAHKEYSIMIRSMSRPGTPTDNPVIEAMNGWIKAAIKVDYKEEDITDVESFINDYIYYYNHERPMSILGYVSPVSYAFSHGFDCSI